MHKPLRKTIGVVCLILLCVAFVGATGQREAADADQTVIRFQSGGYTPNVDRGEHLAELTMLRVIADQYEEIRPDIRVEFLERPDAETTTDYKPWLITQLAAGTAPEVVYGHSTELEQYAPEGWFVDWMPYLQEPNPYIPGNEVWYDTFGKQLVELRRSASGELWSLPVSMVATIIYYNEDLFGEVGVDAPQTWAEFMDVQAQLKDAGVTPMLFDLSTATHLSWSYRIFVSHFYNPLMPEIELGEPDNVVSAEEFARAVTKGIISATDPYHMAALEIYPEWSQYWQSGFLTAPSPGLFERGQTAMWWGGIWAMVELLNDPLREFELGLFSAPQITRETSRHSDESPLPMVGGASGEQWAISESAIKKGIVDDVVDLVRYLTVPEHINSVLAEAMTHAPLIVGGDMPELFKPFVAQLEGGVSPFIVERFFSSQQRDRWFREFQLFMDGQYSVRQYADIVDGIWNDAARTLIENNDWDQSRW